MGFVRRKRNNQQGLNTMPQFLEILFWLFIFVSLFCLVSKKIMKD